MQSAVLPAGNANLLKIPGYKHKLVNEAHRLHLTIPRGFNFKPRCGKQCQWLLGEFQAARHLPKTHRFDNATCFALDHPPQPPISRREHATRIALSFVGVHEQPMGSNRGPFVDKFIRAGEGALIAEPWCADFVTYCEKGAGVVLPKFYYPGAFDWLDAAKKCLGGKGCAQLRLTTLELAVRGDLVVFAFAHIGRFLDHAQLPSGPAVKTVDGNTADCVAIRTRPIDTVLGVVQVVA